MIGVIGVIAMSFHFFEARRLSISRCSQVTHRFHLLRQGCNLFLDFLDLQVFSNTNFFPQELVSAPNQSNLCRSTDAQQSDPILYLSFVAV